MSQLPIICVTNISGSRIMAKTKCSWFVDDRLSIHFGENNPKA